MPSASDKPSRNRVTLRTATRPFRHAIRRALARLWPGSKSKLILQEVYASADRSFQPGHDFEEVDPSIGDGKTPNTKVIAFYLPQFHEFEENNKNWGAGFTEWTNLSRNIPRYRGHIAPRIPRDLGFYDLTQGDIQKRQVRMARNAGIYGFCYYYYRFDGQPFMDAPIERMLADKDVDFPFSLMWCNETWTRAWIGKERSIIAEQKYSDDLTSELVDDLARFFRDPRYIRIQDRPLFTIYRPSFMPEASEQILRIRTLLRERYDIDVLLTMAETDAAVDPRPYGLDGAIEFTANKYNKQLTKALNPKQIFDANCVSAIFDYDELIKLSLAEPDPDYPVVRSVMPHWDKNPRQPGRGHVIHGSTPKKFEEWTAKLAAKSETNPFFGERMLFVNAWNEWAESAYLEPDTHFGGAYLNSVARAVFRSK
ncbi:glycoside hydrolase family 99-like domain-containing protein [Ruegeria hyattellae]|uniref:glycoside hydrolase family 99-like domain-containing protein n=1 Tax=Ruegeria hyattellae TaxID=3233337 RepID=UPI00355C6AED